MKSRYLPYVIAALIAQVLVSTFVHNHYKAKLATVRAGHAEVLRVLAEDNATALDKAAKRAELLQQQVAAIEAHYTQELTDAKANADRLRDAVDTGARRLHILGQRPASCPAAPGAADDTSVGDGAAVELHPTARRTYFSLREGLTSDAAKLSACQEILSALTKGEGDGHGRTID